MTRCSAAAWHDLWVAFHANPADEIYVPVRQLDEVVACHRIYHPGYSAAALYVRTPAKTARRALVRRAQMFGFLTGHGDCRCDNPKGRAP